MTQEVLFDPEAHEELHVPSYLQFEGMTLLQAQIVDYICRNRYTIKTNQEFATLFKTTVKAVKQAIRDLQGHELVIISQAVYERGKTGRIMRPCGHQGGRI